MPGDVWLTRTSTGRTASLYRSARPRKDHDGRRCRRSSMTAVDLGREETRRRLEDRVRSAQLPVLTLKRFQMLTLISREPSPAIFVDLDPGHPLPNCLRCRPELLRDRTDRLPPRPGVLLGPAHHPNSALTQLDEIPPRASLFCHGSILPRDRACALPEEIQSSHAQSESLIPCVEAMGTRSWWSQRGTSPKSGNRNVEPS